MPHIRAALQTPNDRILNVIYNTQRRVLIAGGALAAIGYFDYTYELPRSTLLVTVGTLLVVLPAWFAVIWRTLSGEAEYVVIDCRMEPTPKSNSTQLINP